MRVYEGFVRWEEGVKGEGNPVEGVVGVGVSLGRGRDGGVGSDEGRWPSVTHTF